MDNTYTIIIKTRVVVVQGKASHLGQSSYTFSADETHFANLDDLQTVYALEPAYLSMKSENMCRDRPRIDFEKDRNQVEFEKTAHLCNLAAARGQINRA